MTDGREAIKMEARVAWDGLMAEWASNRRYPSNWPLCGQLAYLQAALAEMRAIKARLAS